MVESDSWAFARAARDALAKHSGPSIWGESDCLILLDDYCVAHGVKVSKGSPYPDWLRKGSRLVSEERAHALAAGREGGAVEAWNAHVRGRYDLLEQRESRPLTVLLAVLPDGSPAVKGPDCRFYRRTSTGLETVDEAGATLWGIVP